MFFNYITGWIFGGKYNGWIDLDTIYNKLKYGNWKEWDKEEQEQINKFVEIDWRNLVNKYENEIWIDDFESYLNFFKLEELLNLWEFPKNKIALKNFIEFFYLNGNDILYSRKVIKINGEDKRNELTNLLERVNLVNKLEEEYFNHETKDNKYAERVSIVLQMIENELKK